MRNGISGKTRCRLNSYTCVSSLALLLAIGAPGAAIAQTAADEGSGNEIVVTAQKREQKASDVGIAVSVLLEVNTSGEGGKEGLPGPSQQGVPSAEFLSTLDAVLPLPNLQVLGLVSAAMVGVCMRIPESKVCTRGGGGSLSPTRVPGIHQRPTSFGCAGSLRSTIIRN